MMHFPSRFQPHINGISSSVRFGNQAYNFSQEEREALATLKSLFRQGASAEESAFTASVETLLVGSIQREPSVHMANGNSMEGFLDYHKALNSELGLRNYPQLLDKMKAQVDTWGMPASSLCFQEDFVKQYIRGY